MNISAIGMIFSGMMFGPLIFQNFELIGWIKRYPEKARIKKALQIFSVLVFDIGMISVFAWIGGLGLYFISIASIVLVALTVFTLVIP